MENIADLLQTAFAAPAEPLPAVFLRLLDRLAAGPGQLRSGLDERQFKAELTAMIPKLRARARYLTRDMVAADDLVQDTLLRAWERRDHFRADSNFEAWTYTVLRNLFFTQTRRAKFRAGWHEPSADRALAMPAEQEHHVHLANLDWALDQLPAAHREVLMLVGAGQLSYEEAAEICGTKVGTIKSRASRARAALTLLIDGPRDAEVVSTAA